MARAKSDAAESGKLDFEDSMKRLETIVDELEGGELSLEDSIARYEEGIQLSKRLTQKLDESEKRIERLVLKGEIDADDAAWPLGSHKPHRYYW